MTVGSIVLVKDAGAAMKPLLGAPVVIRALACTLLPREDVNVVVVAPSSMHQVLQREADRFGFTELTSVLAPEDDALKSVERALRELQGVDHVLVHDGLTALCPVAQVIRVLQASRTGSAAVGVTHPHGAVFFDGEELKERVAGTVAVAQLPAAFRRETLVELCTRGGNASDVLQAAAEAGVPLMRVAGDVDVFPVTDDAALTRALEVWGRRAAEFAFIWPRAGTAQPNVIPGVGPELNLTIPEQPA